MEIIATDHLEIFLTGCQSDFIISNMTEDILHVLQRKGNVKGLLLLAHRFVAGKFLTETHNEDNIVVC